ncbi:hypothetical protein GCM10027447_36900 [Glycomyces halotolerans]
MRRRRSSLAALLLLLAGCAAPTGDDTAEPDQTDPAEPTWSVPCRTGTVPVQPVGDLTLPCLGDGTDTAVAARADRPLVIVLWASWCGPCLAEAPEVEAFHRRHGDRIDVLGVDTADTRQKGRWFAEDFALTYPSVFDPDERVRTGLGVPGLPGVAFVAPDGTVAELVTEPGVTAETLTETAETAFGMDLP